MRLGLLCMLVLVLGGCIQRRIVVTSQPPGALVWINDVEIGRTPAETSFTFYGAYDVRLEMPGFEPVHTSRRTKAPMHEYPGPDLIASALPKKFETVIEWHFDLVPTTSEDPERAEAELLDRARDLRGQTEQGEK